MSAPPPDVPRPSLWVRLTCWFREQRELYPWLEPVRKVGVTLVGVVLLVGGLAIGWLPGPGGFIAFFGLAILAAEFRPVRRLIRQAEYRGHRLYVRILGHKPRWAIRMKRKFRGAPTQC